MFHFFAYMARMKHIKRWGLRHSVFIENVQEHTTQVAMIAHVLAIYHNKRYHGKADIQRVLTYALYHEAAEVITGDLPTPIKYYDPTIKTAYKNIEAQATQRLLQMMPNDVRMALEKSLIPNEECVEWILVKAADRLCAYLKCIEEKRAGNQEFDRALMNTYRAVEKMDLPEIKDFLREFAPSYELTLDDLS